MEDKSDSPFKNFGMMIPHTAIYQMKGYSVMGATQQEFIEFKKYFEKQSFRQLQLNGMPLDMCIRYNDMIVDHVGYSLQGLFDNWKKNPPSAESFTMTTHTFKK